MLKIIKKLNRNIAIKIVFLLLIANIFMVFTKSELIEHHHCDEENCPICEVVYIVNKNLKNVSCGNRTINLPLAVDLFVYLEAFNAQVSVNDYSLVKMKVRIDC